MQSLQNILSVMKTICFERPPNSMVALIYTEVIALGEWEWFSAGDGTTDNFAIFDRMEGWPTQILITLSSISIVILAS